MNIKTQVINRLVNFKMGRTALIKTYCLLKKNKVKNHKALSVLNYCKKNRIFIDIIQNDKFHEVVVFPKINGKKETLIRKKNVPVYPIFVTELQDTVITGCTDGIIVDDCILNDRIDYIKEHAFGPKPFFCVAVDEKKENVLIKQLEVEKIIEKGLCLVGRFPGNWWHLTYELLSKIQLFDMNDKYAEWPIIVDDIVMNNESNRKLLACMNPKNHPIISVRRNQQISVKKMAYASCTVTEILGNYSEEFLNQPTPYHTYLFNNKLSIDYIRSCVLKKKNVNPERKIFIAREKAGRLVNESEVAQYFEDIGFEVLYSDYLSFEEEVEAFSNAKVLISTMGGAMTNIVYCAPSATVVSIFPLKGICAIGMYQEIAHIVGFEFYNQDAKIVKEFKTYDGMEYELPVEECKELIDNLKV